MLSTKGQDRVCSCCMANLGRTSICRSSSRISGETYERSALTARDMAGARCPPSPSTYKPISSPNSSRLETQGQSSLLAIVMGVGLRSSWRPGIQILSRGSSWLLLSVAKARSPWETGSSPHHYSVALPQRSHLASMNISLQPWPDFREVVHLLRMSQRCRRRCSHNNERRFSRNNDS